MTSNTVVLRTVRALTEVCGACVSVRVKTYGQRHVNRLTYLIDAVHVERRVRRRQVVAARRRHKRRNQSDQVIIHVARVAKRSGARGHHRGHELIGLGKGGIRNAQTV